MGKPLQPLQQPRFFEDQLHLHPSARSLGQLVDQHIAEKGRCVLTDRMIGRHKAKVGIHGVGFFVAAAGANLRDIPGFVMATQRKIIVKFYCISANFYFSGALLLP